MANVLSKALMVGFALCIILTIIGFSLRVYTIYYGIGMIALFILGASLVASAMAIIFYVGDKP